MTLAEIRNHRLLNQHIAFPSCKTPQEVVSSLVAMQAQEFAFAKWAIGLRMPTATESLIDKAFNDGEILRTHLMRPTWHFVAPADIRWLLELTRPRVMQVNAFIYRQEGLETKTFNRSNDIIARALEGKYLQRTELQAILAKQKLHVSGTALSAIMMQAELDGIICSGPRQGKQFSYALLDERVPPVKPLNRMEALIQLATRYFASRGPASIKDFTTWSGLTVKDAKEGIVHLPKTFERTKINGDDYFFIPRDIKAVATKAQRTFLMSPYDEFGMAYKDRSAFLPAPGERSKESLAFSHLIIVDGMATGSWKPAQKGKTTTVDYTIPATLSQKHLKEVEAAVSKYKAFVAK
jgi:hypothetical protein